MKHQWKSIYYKQLLKHSKKKNKQTKIKPILQTNNKNIVYEFIKQFTIAPEKYYNHFSIRERSLYISS